MKIAAIIVTYNDDYKVNQWFDYYKEYKAAIFLYIIVDNGSERDYIKTVENLFANSVVIKRGRNDGSTAAYNDGIRYALKVEEIDSIMLIGNDIKISAESISTLHNILFNHKQYGIITPILFQKDSDIIADYGCCITKNLYMKPDHLGERVNDSLPLIKEVPLVTGGMNLAKREYYDNVGLQDEKLFMYSDEVDMGLRMAKTELKAVITRQSCAWHQHINPGNTMLRQGYAEFLVNRNKIYLGYKHYGFAKAFSIFLGQIVKAPRHGVSFLKKRAGILIVYYILGSICGICRIEKNFRTIIENKL